MRLNLNESPIPITSCDQCAIPNEERDLFCQDCGNRLSSHTLEMNGEADLTQATLVHETIGQEEQQVELSGVASRSHDFRS